MLVHDGWQTPTVCLYASTFTPIGLLVTVDYNIDLLELAAIHEAFMQHKHVALTHASVLLMHRPTGLKHFDKDDDNNLLDTMAPAIDPGHCI